MAAVLPDEPPEIIEAGLPRLAKPADPLATDRLTLCITCSTPDVVLQNGDAGFREQVSQYYESHENEINEKLLRLKKKLRTIHDAEFWSVASSGLGELLGAQYAFISKRLDHDDQSTPAAFDDPGACMLGMSLYIQDANGVGHASGEVQYVARGAPCEYMKHNKVLLIPNNLPSVILNNPNQLPSQPEAYMATPLSYLPAGSTKEKVFGHFGVMWTAEGIAKQKSSFALIENVLHSLEDLFVTRFYEFGHLDLPQTAPDQPSTAVVKQISSSSFKPYARSLSHELRTPMQGVVGMLDLMYAAVQEASEGTTDTHTRSVFRTLKENIEEVHDSARRAVEAADNVVHAYDMDMGVPDAPSYNNEDDEVSTQKWVEAPPDVADAFPHTRSTKKRRSKDDTAMVRSAKMPRLDSTRRSNPLESPIQYRERILPDSPVITPAGSVGTPILEGTPSSVHLTLERMIAPGVRSTVISDILQSIINDVIKIGGRPESAIAHPIDGGEEIEVRHRAKDSQEIVRMVRWNVDAAVPESIMVDERDLAGLLSRVLHNAFKFTNSGSIDTKVRLSPKGKYILINITDTGHGIPKAFMPSLFKPFSKEDDSTTRQSEGLGLGLMVAKGLARRLNGDLYAIRSDTEGLNRGTEFEMRIPLMPGDANSRSSTPFGSRSPSASMSFEPDHALHAPRSPRPQLRRGGPGHLLNNPLDATAVSNVFCPSMPTPPSTASPMLLSTTNPASTANSTSHPRMSPTIIPRRNSHHRKTPPYRQAGEKLATVLPLSFLVVEDNSLLRKVLVHMLRNLGYDRIHQAYDGADALRQMEEHRAKFLAGQESYEIDFILMDLWMPNMNGYSAAEHILRNSATGPDHAIQGELSAKHGWKMPIIMAVTADVTDEAMESVSKSGMKGPLTKPYKQVDLERTLVELCGISIGAPVMAGC